VIESWNLGDEAKGDRARGEIARGEMVRGERVKGDGGKLHFETIIYYRNE